MGEVSVTDIEDTGANIADEVTALKTLAFRLLDEVEEKQIRIKELEAQNIELRKREHTLERHLADATDECPKCWCGLIFSNGFTCCPECEWSEAIKGEGDEDNSK